MLADYSSAGEGSIFPLIKALAVGHVAGAVAVALQFRTRAMPADPTAVSSARPILPHELIAIDPVLAVEL